MVNALLDAHELTNNTKYLSTAITLFNDIKAAWDTVCCGAHPGV
jgi:uncharacterized protein YyaL (SSP411 family)